MDRHSFDFVSLVFGLAFAVVGIAIASGALRLEDAGLGSVIPMGIGFLGLTLAALTLNRYLRVKDEDASLSEEPRSDLTGEERSALGESQGTIDSL